MWIVVVNRFKVLLIRRKKRKKRLVVTECNNLGLVVINFDLLSLIVIGFNKSPLISINFFPFKPSSSFSPKPKTPPAYPKLDLYA